MVFGGKKKQTRLGGVFRDVSGKVSNRASGLVYIAKER